MDTRSRRWAAILFLALVAGLCAAAPATGSIATHSSAQSDRVSYAPEVDCAVPPFADVVVNHPFCSAIEWMSDQGISTGYVDGSFRPGASVTRQAMAAFLHRFANPTEDAADCGGKSPFVDVPADHAFCGAIAWMAGEGISTGYEGDRFGPDQPVTRQAMAAFLYRLHSGGDEAPGCTFTPFRDITRDHPFCPSISWMSASLISTGTVTDQGRIYKPADPVSRGAMAAFLSRAFSDGHLIRSAGGALSGTVVAEADGTPLADVLVIAYPVHRGVSRQPSVSVTRTGAGGAWEFTDLRTDMEGYRLCFDPRDVVGGPAPAYLGECHRNVAGYVDTWVTEQFGSRWVRAPGFDISQVVAIGSDVDAALSSAGRLTGTISQVGQPAGAGWVTVYDSEGRPLQQIVYSGDRYQFSVGLYSTALRPGDTYYLCAYRSNAPTYLVSMGCHGLSGPQLSSTFNPRDAGATPFTVSATEVTRIDLVLPVV